MRPLLVWLILSAVGAALVSGCTGDTQLPEATGKGTIRAINTIPTSPSIDLLIEELFVDSVGFKTSSNARQFDDLEYTFNFEVIFPSGRRRVASQFLDVAADKDYTFVIDGALANPTITVIEADVRMFAETDTVFEARFGHLGNTLGDLDVYFAAPGVAPALGQQIATLSQGDISGAVDFPEGDYVLIYTAAGDPATVRFTSDTIAPTVRTAFTIGIFDADANELGPASVRLFDASGMTLSITDVNVVPTVRFHHTSMALATADIYDDDPTMVPAIVSGHAFGDVTGDIPVVIGSNSFTYTAAGDTSVILFEDDLNLSTGTRNNYYVVGGTDALSAIAVIVDRRSVETLVKLSFVHAAANHALIDLYIVDVDADITDLFPTLFNVPIGTASIVSNVQAGSFDIYMTVAGEKMVIVGPVRLDVSLGDVVDLIAYDTVDPATADLVFVPLP